MKTKAEIVRENDVARVLLSVQDRVLALLVLLLVIGVGVVAFLGYVRFAKFPVAQALAANDAQAVCAPIALDQPSVSQSKLRNIASTIAQRLNRFDYYNWKIQLNEELASDFTATARDQYRAALQQGGRVNKVIENFQVVSSAVSAPPEIVNEGVERGVYTYQVKVPLAVFYRTQTDTKRESRVVEMKMVRVPASPVNPDGMAVAEIITTPATSEEFVR